MSSDRVLELRVYRIHHGRRGEFIARMRDHLVRALGPTFLHRISIAQRPGIATVNRNQ